MDIPRTYPVPGGPMEPTPAHSLLQQFTNVWFAEPWSADHVGGRRILLIGPREDEFRDALRRCSWKGGGPDIRPYLPQIRFCAQERDLWGHSDFLAFVWGVERLSDEKYAVARVLRRMVKEGRGRWLQEVIGVQHPLWLFINEVRR